ncbi:MAG: hypothetical protein KC502_04770 [Myxococcales bacterium]|nr:hypothetical protein [Myxococcales bacterium]
MATTWILTEDAASHEVSIISDDGQTAVVDVNGTRYNVNTQDLPDGRIAVTGIGADRTFRSYDDHRGKWIAEGPNARCFDVADERSTWLGALAGGGSDAGGDIKASMPGRVVRVAVETGDVVPAGGIVAVLEAMKMENDIKSAGGGTVVEVGVVAGQTVEAGQLLVRLEEVQ